MRKETQDKLRNAEVPPQISTKHFDEVNFGTPQARSRTSLNCKDSNEDYRPKTQMFGLGFRKFSHHNVGSNFTASNRLGARIRRSQEPLTDKQIGWLEDVMPCPYDPAAQSVLSLKGQNKLMLEADSAKRNAELFVLNNDAAVPSLLEKLDANVCLVE